MNIFRTALLCLLVVALVLPVGGQQPAKKRLLAIGMSMGWQHDSVSDALATLYNLGKETGLWDTYIRTDVELITKKELKANARNLDYFDAVFFMTTGELPMDDQQKADLLSFIREDGKGFLGAHNATDTFYKWPEFGEMIGGYFDGHPWNTFMAPVKVTDRSHPTTKHFPADFQIMDEIYQTKEFVPEKVRVLMTLDTSKVDMKAKGVKHQSIPITWVKDYGKGRVFYCGLGHPPEVWGRSDLKQMWIEAVKWSMKITD
jgi:uncharacterized protein